MQHFSLKSIAAILLLGYGLEFLSGILLALLRVAPLTRPVGGFTHNLVWSLGASGGWELALHTYLGLTLSVGSLLLLLLAQQQRRFVLPATVITMTTVGAFLNGLSLVSLPKTLSSVVMGGCWLVSVVTVSSLLLHWAPVANTTQATEV